MINIMEYYTYAYLDPRKPGNFKFGNYIFEFEPFYIGKGKGNRLTKHLKFVKERGIDLTNNSYKYNLIKQILRSELEPIIIKIEENICENLAFNLEKLLISSIGNRIEGTGPLVNISKGGEGGDNFSNNPRKEEIREMRKKQMSGSGNNMYGLKLEEYPSNKLKGENHWNKGKKHSIETKKIWSDQRSGEKNSRAKSVIQLSLTGEILKEFSTAKAASESNKINHGNIIRSCKDENKTAGGFKWKYKK